MFELRPETWTRLMVAVMRLPVGPGPGYSGRGQALELTWRLVVFQCVM